MEDSHPLPCATVKLPGPARPTTDARRLLGQRGEERAAAWLAARGYRIVERNVRCGGVEIDLVAESRGLVVFVEVKTRRGHGSGAPEEAVDPRKRRRLVRGAAAWLREHPGPPRDVRFDVVTCEPAGAGGMSVTHIEGAFDAGDG